MNWRAVVEYSFSDDTDSRGRNQLVAILEQFGLTREARCTWKSSTLNYGEAAELTAKVLHKFSTVDGEQCVNWDIEVRMARLTIEAVLP